MEKAKVFLSKVFPKKEVKGNTTFMTSNGRKISIISVSVVLSFLFVWFALSFISMRSSNPYVDMYIDLSDEDIVNTVGEPLPKRDGKYLEYSFQVLVEDVKRESGSDILTGLPLNFKDMESESFEFEFKKSQGTFDFAQVIYGDPLTVTLKYRVDQDFRYFREFSICSIKKVFSKLFNLENQYSESKCVIERELNTWEVVLGKPTEAQIKNEFTEIDTDRLIKELLNYYMSSDSGYLLSDGIFKVRSVQEGKSKDDVNFVSTFSSIDMKESSYPLWFVNGLSLGYLKGYEDVDLLPYMELVLSNSVDDVGSVFADCQAAYSLISNLESCNTPECAEIKNSAYLQCKKTLEYEMETYDVNFDTYGIYRGGDTYADYPIYMPSEIIYYNRILSLLGINEYVYTEDSVNSYYRVSERISQRFPSVVRSCYMLKNIEEIYLEYKDTKYVEKVNEIYSRLPNFENICNTKVYPDYCDSTIAKKVVCADALSYSNPEISKKILFDLYYRYYSGSDAFSNTFGYENFRSSLRRADTSKKGISLDEYGYFVYTYTNENDIEVMYTDMIDSYYFINILNKVK